MPPEHFPLTSSENALVLEWERLSTKGNRERGALLAADRALRVLIQRGHLTRAKEIADWMLDMARGAFDTRAEDTESLRDLSVSLDHFGNVDRALGELESARGCFVESLEISRRLVARVGETPESLRDLSVSLDHVGNVDRALGELESARGCFVESLEISRRLVARVGETPESLRDLSVSLNKVGEMERALGELESARALWEEGLEIARRLTQALPSHADYKDLDRWFRERLSDLDEETLELHAP